MKYTLEVYGPGDDATPHAVFSSETPFGSIHKGDFFNPVISAEKKWKVTDVEHIVWGTAPAISHKVMIHTEEVRPH